MRRVRALVAALILTGFALMAGGAQMRAVSDTPDKPPLIVRWQRDDPLQGKFDELNDLLEAHRICTEQGTWDQWPCNQWSPPSPNPQD